MAFRNLDIHSIDETSFINTKIGPYIVQKFIGRGAYGSVYRGIDDNKNKQVAIKVLDLRQIEKDPNQKVRDIRRRLARTESELMMVCESDNVLKCYQVFENKSLKIMIIEYCNGGSLEQEIIEKKRIPEKQAINILKQLILGISELHSHNIIHRDLKPQNILIHNGVYKLADFGFSKQLSKEQDIKQTTLGTIITMAPEIIDRKPYGLKADIWSLGVIFYHMLVGKLPFSPQHANVMSQQIKNKKVFAGNKLVDETVQLSSETIDCLKRMMMVKPEERLGWKQLLQHQIFKEKPDESLIQNFKIRASLEAAKLKPNLQGELINLEDDDDISLPDLDENTKIKLKSKQKETDAPKIEKITKKEVEDKVKNVDLSESQAYQWAKKTYWQCLKTELILKNIIFPIEINEVLGMTRNDLQCLYLLSARCFSNLSPINEQVNKHKNQIAINLKTTILDIYQKSFKKFQQYSQKLKNQEDKLTSIVGDKFSKFIKKESYHQKQKFLQGFEAAHQFSVKGVCGQKPSQKQFSDFTKEQQITYTAKIYIPDLIKQLQKKKSKLEFPIKLLNHYEEINLLKYNQKIQFSELIREITKK